MSTYIHIHTQIHTYIHTHTHTYSYLGHKGRKHSTAATAPARSPHEKPLLARNSLTLIFFDWINLKWKSATVTAKLIHEHQVMSCFVKSYGKQLLQDFVMQGNFWCVTFERWFLIGVRKFKKNSCITASRTGTFDARQWFFFEVQSEMISFWRLKTFLKKQLLDHPAWTVSSN